MLIIKPDLRSFTYDELENFIIENGFAKFRAKQIFKWLHTGVQTFDEMTNLSKSDRLKLDDISRIAGVTLKKKFVSAIDGTVKFLFELDDGNLIETVVMKYNHGYSICVSCQVGCRMGCSFCQSTKAGLVRSLLAGEILGQILEAQRILQIRISNIVMMGIGEPLDNFENSVRFLQIVNHPEGVNIGYRHISLSTCGLVDKIVELSKYNLPITLSISLHSAFDEKRSEMMPINKKYNINSLIAACREYQAVTGRRISFEYSLINGVNDTRSDALELIKLLKGLLYHINLIPVNRIENGKYFPPDMKVVESFCSLLNKMGAACTVRRTLGSDISASCGQLKSKYDSEVM